MVWIVILIVLCLMGMIVVLRAMFDELLSRVEALEGGDKKHAA
jgi:hypothetical protein